MKLKATGTIEIGEYRARFTESDGWAISRHGIFVGYAPTLEEIQTIIDTNLVTVRTRLRAAQDRAEQNKLETP